MPDVILWMMSGDKRVAYYRIPAHDLLFSNNVNACGKFCGKIVELPLKVTMQIIGYYGPKCEIFICEILLLIQSGQRIPILQNLEQ